MQSSLVPYILVYPERFHIIKDKWVTQFHTGELEIDTALPSTSAHPSLTELFVDELMQGLNVGQKRSKMQGIERVELLAGLLLSCFQLCTVST